MTFADDTQAPPSRLTDILFWGALVAVAALLGILVYQLDDLTAAVGTARAQQAQIPVLQQKVSHLEAARVKAVEDLKEPQAQLAAVNADLLVRRAELAGIETKIKEKSDALNNLGDLPAKTDALQKAIEEKNAELRRIADTRKTLCLAAVPGLLRLDDGNLRKALETLIKLCGPARPPFDPTERPDPTGRPKPAN